MGVRWRCYLTYHRKTGIYTTTKALEIRYIWNLQKTMISLPKQTPKDDNGGEQKALTTQAFEILLLKIVS